MLSMFVTIIIIFTILVSLGNIMYGLFNILLSVSLSYLGAGTTLLLLVGLQDSLVHIHTSLVDNMDCKSSLELVALVN